MISLTALITLTSAFSAAVFAVPVNKRDTFSVIQGDLSGINNSLVKADDDAKGLGNQGADSSDFVDDFNQLIDQIDTASQDASLQKTALNDDQANQLDFSGLGNAFVNFVGDIEDQIPVLVSDNALSTVRSLTIELENSVVTYISQISRLLPSDDQYDADQAKSDFQDLFQGLIDDLDKNSPTGSSSGN